MTDMSIATQRVEELFDQAFDLPYGPAQIQVLADATRHADAAGDEQLGFAARMYQVQAGTYGGDPRQALAAYVWCQQRLDAAAAEGRDLRGGNPWASEFDDHHVLWMYKWIVAGLPNFETVSRAQIEEALEDLRVRFERHGATSYAWQHIRIANALEMGDIDVVRDLIEPWVRTERDDLSDCLACCIDERIRAFAAIGDDERAVREAQPVLDGLTTCADQPQSALSLLLEPLVRLGRLTQAEEVHRRGLERIRNPYKSGHLIVRHLRYLLAVGREEHALFLLERHMRFSDQGSPGTQLEFAAIAARVIRAAMAQGLVVPRFPAAVLVFSEEDLRPAAVADALWEQAITLAAAFDARNGNDHVSRSTLGDAGSPRVVLATG